MMWGSAREELSHPVKPNTHSDDLRNCEDRYGVDILHDNGLDRALREQIPLCGRQLLNSYFTI